MLRDSPTLALSNWSASGSGWSASSLCRTLRVQRAVRPTPLFDSCEEIALALIDSRYLTPLVDACDEMVQALVFSRFLEDAGVQEGMKLMPWLEAVFELYEDAPFLKVDMIEFKKAKASPIVHQLEFLPHVRRPVGLSGPPRRHTL